MRGKPEDVTMTREEFKKIRKSFRDEKFNELMGDYMKEISDPKNVEEYDKYLEQLHREGELPSGMSLIQPEPQFCIKSTLASKKDKKFSQAIYINICSHDIVAKPEIRESGGKKNWMVPYFVGKIRYDQEGEEVVNTVDWVFNIESIEFANKHPQYHKLVCETALDATQNVLIERKEKVNRDYTIPKLKFKGEKIALLPIVVSQISKDALNKERNKQPGGKIYQEIMDQKSEYQKAKLNNKSNKENIDDFTPMDEIEEAEEKEEEEVLPDLSNGPIAPKYSVVYSYPIELGDFTNIQDVKEVKAAKVPTQMKIRIELPLVENMENLHVDTKTTSLHLEYDKIYFLSLSFLYEINSEAGTAKFISKKKMLELSFPIIRKLVNNVVPVSYKTSDTLAEREQVDLAVATEQVRSHEIDTLIVDQAASLANNDLPENQKTSDNDQEIDNSKPENTIESNEAPQIVNDINAVNESKTENEGENCPAHFIQEIEPQMNGNTEVKEEKADLKNECLEVNLFIEPQVTNFGTTTIYLFHLKDYDSTQVELGAFGNKLLMVYTEENRPRYFWLQAQDGDCLENLTINKKFIKDYISFSIDFKDEESSEVFKQTSIPIKDLSLSDVRKTSLEIKNLLFKKEIEERDLKGGDITEIASESIKKNTEGNEDVNDEEFNPNPPEEDVTKKEQKEDEDAAPEPAKDANSYGIQLLHLDILDCAFEMD